jgi:hypothetical protein
MGLQQTDRRQTDDRQKKRDRRETEDRRQIDKDKHHAAYPWPDIAPAGLICPTRTKGIQVTKNIPQFLANDSSPVLPAVRLPIIITLLSLFGRTMPNLPCPM